METITLKIDGRSKAGKAVKALLETLKDQKGVEVVKDEDESPYDPEFVKMVKQREANLRKNECAIVLDPDDVWGSIL